VHTCSYQLPLSNNTFSLTIEFDTWGDADIIYYAWHMQKLSDAGKLSLLQEMYRDWPFMQVLLYTTCVYHLCVMQLACCNQM
jgi:hypothetical protein